MGLDAVVDAPVSAPFDVVAPAEEVDAILTLMHNQLLHFIVLSDIGRDVGQVVVELGMVVVSEPLSRYSSRVDCPINS